MQYPNKTFVYETTTDHYHLVVILVASSKEIGADYLKTKFPALDIHPNQLTWLMNCNHPTLYDQKGNKPLDVQAKIMYKTRTLK